VLTPAGAAAIAVIAVEGGRAKDVVMGRMRMRGGANTLVLGKFVDSEGGAIDEVIVHSQPDNDRYAELHCHGGAAVTRAAVEELKVLGCTEISTKEMLLRRHRNGTYTTIETEALLLLSEGLTARAAELVQASITVLTEAAESGNREQMEQMLNEAGPLERLCKIHKVAIAGAENSGKSTLANALGGSSLVSEIPGTTRDAVRRLADWDGMMVEIIDTAGLGEGKTPLHREAHKRAIAAMKEAELVLWVVSNDTEEPPTPKEAEGKTFLVVNKFDRFPGLYEVGFTVSALTGQYVDRLRNALFHTLIGGEPKAGVFTLRQAEAIRLSLDGQKPICTLLEDVLPD
jgi:tRNA modification GTPase